MIGEGCGGGRVVLKQILAVALLGAGVCAGLDRAWAQAPRQHDFRMECDGEKGPYAVVYDTRTRLFGNQNPSFSPPYGLRQAQIDEDGALVWAFVRVHYGERDMLARFGREKWIRYFYGNGSEVMHRCR